MPNADVFISYKRDQREIVHLIADSLQELGLSIWFDARLEAGTSFDEEINREVRSAKAVLVCWTPEATASLWVRSEASIGLERQNLVAVLLQPAELPAPFNLIHAADLRGWNKTFDAPEWIAVLKRIGRLVGRTDLPDLARASGRSSRQQEGGERIAAPKHNKGEKSVKPISEQPEDRSPAPSHDKRAQRTPAGVGKVLLYALLLPLAVPIWLFSTLLSGEGIRWSIPLAFAFMLLGLGLAPFWGGFAPLAAGSFDAGPGVVSGMACGHVGVLLLARAGVGQWGGIGVVLASLMLAWLLPWLFIAFFFFFYVGTDTFTVLAAIAAAFLVAGAATFAAARLFKYYWYPE